jgi:hypothetical protein
VNTVPISELKPAPWATSHVLRPDERLLISSLIEYGWIVPLVVQKDTMVVLDGNQRLRLALHDKKVSTVVSTDVPVVFVECDDIDAMIVHVRLNRGRGMVVAKRMSTLIQEMLIAGKYDESEIMKKFVMTSDEFDVLADGIYLKSKAVSQHRYSFAWVPIEAPKPGDVVSGMSSERPLNPDN